MRARSLRVLTCSAKCESTAVTRDAPLSRYALAALMSVPPERVMSSYIITCEPDTSPMTLATEVPASVRSFCTNAMRAPKRLRVGVRARANVCAHVCVCMGVRARRGLRQL